MPKQPNPGWGSPAKTFGGDNDSDVPGMPAVMVEHDLSAPYTGGDRYGNARGIVKGGDTSYKGKGRSGGMKY